MRTLKDNWETFRDQVLPKTLPIAQIAGFKKIFYMGALNGMILISEAARLSNPQSAAEKMSDLMLEAQIECEGSLFNKFVLSEDIRKGQVKM